MVVAIKELTNDLFVANHGDHVSAQSGCLAMFVAVTAAIRCRVNGRHDEQLGYPVPESHTACGLNARQ